MTPQEAQTAADNFLRSENFGGTGAWYQSSPTRFYSNHLMTGEWFTDQGVCCLFLDNSSSPPVWKLQLFLLSKSRQIVESDLFLNELPSTQDLIDQLQVDIQDLKFQLAELRGSDK